MNRRRFTFVLGSLCAGIVAVPRALHAGTDNPIRPAAHSTNTRAAFAATTMDDAIAKLGLSTMSPSEKITIPGHFEYISVSNHLEQKIGHVHLRVKADLAAIEMIAVLFSIMPFPLVYVVKGDINSIEVTVKIPACLRGDSYSAHDVEILAIVKTSTGVFFNKRTVRFSFGTCTMDPGTGGAI